MKLDKQDSPDTYDNIINDLGDGGDEYLVGKGLIVLEAQEKQYGFLTKVVRIILHDQSLDQVDPPTIVELPTTCISQAHTTSSLFTSVFAGVPYRSPPVLDTQYLLELAGFRRESAKAHAHAMREDPLYFKSELYGSTKSAQPPSSSNLKRTLQITMFALYLYAIPMIVSGKSKLELHTYFSRVSRLEILFGNSVPDTFFSKGAPAYRTADFRSSGQY
jgi:hypothetical protein